MSALLKVLLCLAAAVLAFCTAVFFIVMSGRAANPPAAPVHATAAAVPAPGVLVVRVRAVPQGVAVTGLLLPAPDRVPALREDRVYDLDPHAGSRPLTWRSLLTPPGVHRA